MSAKELTTGETAAILGVSPRSVLRYVDRGYLLFRLTPGGHHRYDEAAVRRLRKLWDRGQ